MDSVNHDSNTALVRVFVTLQMIGCFAFVLMVFSALVFPSVKRHPVWYNFCLSWIVFGLSYSLLSFAGQQYTLSTENICLAQATMVYAAPFLAGGASIALIIQLLLNILSALSRHPVKKTYPVIVTLTIVLPWTLWTAILVGAVVFAIRNRDHVSLSPNGTFCIVERSPIPRLTAVAAAFFSFVILVLEVLIVYLLYHHRTIKDVFRQSIVMAFRVFIFTGVALTAAAVGVIFASTDSRGAVFDIMIAIVPPSTAIIFGSQKDLWEPYMFWRTRGSSSRDHASESSTIDTMTIPATISLRRRSSISSIPRPPDPTPYVSTESTSRPY